MMRCGMQYHAVDRYVDFLIAAVYSITWSITNELDSILLFPALTELRRRDRTGAAAVWAR